MDDNFLPRSIMLTSRHNNRTIFSSLFRFNTVPGYDGAGSHAERAQRLSAGKAFALPKRALQGDIPMLARRSRSQAGVPDPTQGSRPTTGGQHERALCRPWELRFRVHRLREVAGGNLRLIALRNWSCGEAYFWHALVLCEQGDFLMYLDL